MNSWSPLRIGIIGCGRVMSGPYMALIELMSRRGDVTVEIVCDIDERKVRTAAARFNISRTTCEATEVIESSQVDIVMILSSMKEHGSFTLAALRAGKHVLVEKPMASDLSTAREIVELSRMSRGLLVVAPHIVLSPTYSTIHHHISCGDIGSVYSARARYGWSGPDWGEWFYRKGGGAMFDLGVYNVTALTGLIGPVRRVTALVGTAISERLVNGNQIAVEADDNAHILLDFGNAVFAVVTTGFTIQKYRSPAIEIYGGDGTIQMLGDDWNPNGYELWRNAEGSWRTFIEKAPSWPWTEGIRHLVECVHDHRKPINTPEHAYHVLEIMLKAAEAGRTGQVQPIKSTFEPIVFSRSRGCDEPAHRIHDGSWTA